MSGAQQGKLRLRLPATSANLGPGFDTLALALALYLEVDAEVSDAFSIDASGRSQAVCSALDGNLLLDTYTEMAARYGKGPVQPLALTIRNGIPLGMGCGSSAASRLAGIALASHFSRLGWDASRMLEEATALEHHPDNAAACCLGGFVASGYGPAVDTSPLDVETMTPRLRRVQALSIAPPAAWHALLVLPELPFATTESRAVLPSQYGREQIVVNLQNVAVLVAAFASGRGELLAAATGDRLHQPYRGEVCPLLPRLVPLAGSDGILSVTLSGAGSGVLCLLENKEAVQGASARVRERAADATLGPLAIEELLACDLAQQPALLTGI